MKLTKLIVYSVEGLTCSLICFFLGAQGFFGSDFMPYPGWGFFFFACIFNEKNEIANNCNVFELIRIWYFGTGFSGLSMFNTTLIALFYRNLRMATNQFIQVRLVFFIFIFILFFGFKFEIFEYKPPNFYF
jgi:hypothetical protein